MSDGTRRTCHVQESANVTRLLFQEDPTLGVTNMIRFRTSTPKFVKPELATALGDRFSQHELAMMSQLGTVIELEAGTTFATEGEVGREALVILDGTATVIRHDDVIGIVETGDIVGEMSLLSNERRNASIVTSTAVTVAVFTRQEFLSLLDVCPRIDAVVRELVVERQHPQAE